MTVYFILPNLSAGGAERVTITIARLLRSEGIPVTFINIGVREGEMLSWIEPEFRMISFGYSRVLSAIPKLYTFMKKHPDSLYFSSREHVNVVGLLTAKLSNREIITRIPNMPRNVLTKGVLGQKMRLIKAINKWLLKSAKMIIAQNNEMKEQLIDYYNLPSYKVIAINNPIDKEYVCMSANGSINPFKENEVNYLNVCNISYSKGIDILLKAWPKVKDAIPNAHMYVIGRNTSDYAKKLLESSNELKEFTYLGFQSNPYPFLKHCDVFVLPSRMEGFPNVVLEAMCFNRPIASTTCVEVIKNIINDGVNGYYCEIENSEELANCMIKAAELKNIDNDYDLFDKQALISIFD